MQSDLSLAALVAAVAVLSAAVALILDRSSLLPDLVRRVREGLGAAARPAAATPAELAAEHRDMLDGVASFQETVAREVMTPRIDVVAVPADVSLQELTRIAIRSGHSRLPVYEGTIDTVVGVLLVKDLLPLLAAPERVRRLPFDLRRIMRAPYFVPDGKPLPEILAEFRQQSVHLAIVLDEFGGTYGVVSAEDLVEEIVGEINDEYDVAEPDFALTADGDVLIDGGASVTDVNERFALALPEEDFDTVGGFVFGRIGRVPDPGDEVAGLGADADMSLVVEEIEERRVLRVRLTRSAPASETAAD